MILEQEIELAIESASHDKYLKYKVKRLIGMAKVRFKNSPEKLLKLDLLAKKDEQTAADAYSIIADMLIEIENIVKN